MGEVIGPEQVLLSNDVHSRPGCRRESLARNSGVGVGGHMLILGIGRRNLLQAMYTVSARTVDAPRIVFVGHKSKS